ncbi:MAG: accessory gene regulator B family protein [Lachnospiraceae bacterium]|nr:accessory gene regulator B family protein [Lachnospiraceae bacterium]
MIQKLSEKIVDSLMHLADTEDDRDIYLYGMECFISEFVGDITLFLIALFLGQFWEMVLWTISFLAIRTHLGGYHCETHFRCYIASTLLGMVSLPLNHLLLDYPYVTVILMLLCLLFILRYAPIVHKNHPRSSDQIRSSKKLTWINFIILSFLAILLACHQNTIYAPLCSGVILATLLGWIQIIRRSFL